MLLLIAFVCYNLLKELKIRNFFLIKKNYTLKIFSALNHFVFDFSKYCTKYWKDLVFKFWMTMQQYIPRYVYIIYLISKCTINVKILPNYSSLLRKSNKYRLLMNVLLLSRPKNKREHAPPPAPLVPSALLRKAKGSSK